MSFVNEAIGLRLLEESGQGESKKAQNSRRNLVKAADQFIEEIKTKIEKRKSKIEQLESKYSIGRESRKN